MGKEQFRQKIEELDPEGLIPQEIVEELIQATSEVEENPPIGMTTSSIEFGLREQLRQEIDWRRRASIAARIISLGLD